jgi:hypothetical protein
VCSCSVPVWSQDEWFKKNLQDDQDLADQLEFDSMLPTEGAAAGTAEPAK